MVDRGISENTLRKHGIGLRKRSYGKEGAGVDIVIPRWRDGFCVGVKYVPHPRTDKGSGYRFRQAKGSSCALFPEPDLSDKSKLLIVESELDAMMLESLGYRASSCQGTSGYTHAVLGECIESGVDVCLLPDDDEAGQAVVPTLGRMLRAPGTSLRVRVPGQLARHGAKDVGELLKHGVEELKKIVDGLAFDVLHHDERSETLSLLEYDEEGRILRNTRNLRMILGTDPTWAGLLWTNEMGRVLMYGDEPFVDSMIVDFVVLIFERYRVEWSRETVFEVVLNLCSKNRKHPVREWLNSLQWDGVERISHLIGDVLQIPKGEPIALKQLYIRKWMISAVARVMQPGCKADAMLVLYSRDQGIGKSSLARELGSPWFCDAPIRPDDKDSVLVIHRYWIIEVSELDATTRKRDVAELRAFLSRAEDDVRKPYGRVSEVYPRMSVFLGTTNDPEVVREDDGRRYLPIHVESIDVEPVAAMRDQLWAEALHYFRQGESWWLDRQSEVARRQDTEEHWQPVDPILEAVEKYLAETGDGGDAGIHTADLGKAMKESGVAVGSNALGRVLRKLGFVHTKMRWPKGVSRDQQVTLWRWVKAGKSGPTEQVPPGDEEIPP